MFYLLTQHWIFILLYYFQTIDKIAVRPNKAKIKSQSKVITVWKNMTVQELATSMEKDIGLFPSISTYFDFLNVTIIFF